jgi:RNA ligase (TIGR02306 family)
MRTLASIQKIKALEPIEGADAIEKATVLGWSLVVKKNDFKVGDLVVYCEIDSILPEIDLFEFLKPRGMRIRTVRLRGQISQGICFPLSIVEHFGLLPEDMIEGQDVTDAMGVIKYEPPIPACLSGVMKGKFPSFIPKTDETRVQVLQKLLDKYEGESCYITEKLDGSSATYYLKDGQFGVCSRNMELLESEENSFWKVARELDIENKLLKYGKNIAIQGELVGEGIQGNKLKLKGQKVYFFNGFDIDRFEYLDYKQFHFLMAVIGLDNVPILAVNYTLSNNIDSIINLAKIKSTITKDVWAEGIVIRPHVEKIDLILSNENFNNGRVSFKAINPEFLIKYGE